MIAGVPYDAEIEYLESTGTQWIDTDYVPTAGAFAIDMTALTPWHSGFMMYFGAYVSHGNRFYATNIGAGTTKIAWQYGTATLGETFFPSVKRGRTNYTFSGNTHPFFVFYMSNCPSEFYPANARFRSAKFWNSSGILVLDLIPVRKGTTGYLFDRVTRRLFGNSGTGSFVLGPDVARPVLPVRVVSVKPYDAEIEYLESTGTQCVDTGIYPNQANTSFDLDISFHGDFKPSSSLSSSQTTNVLRAGDTTTNRYGFNFGSVQTQYQDLFTWFKSNTATSQNYVHAVIDRLSRQHITYDAGSFAAGDTTWTTPHGSADLQGHLLLLGAYSSATDEYKSFGCYNARIYGFKVWQTGTLVLDLIPVRVGTAGYLFDRVSGQLFGNAGTGSFVLGTDTGVERPLAGLVPVARNVRRILPYDAEVEYVESTGTQYVDTGVIGGEQTRWTVDCAITDTRDQNRFTGQVATATAPSNYLARFNFGRISDGKWYCSFGSVQFAAQLGAGDTSRHIFDLDAVSKSFSLDGSVLQAAETIDWLYPSSPIGGICLFGRRFLDTGDVAPIISMRVWSSRIYQGGTLVRSFVPVRVGTVGYLYDRANPTGGPLGNGLYGSATSTPLVAGPG